MSHDTSPMTTAAHEIETNLFDFVKAYAVAAQGAVQERSTLTLVDSHMLMPYFNGVLRTRLDEGDAESVVPTLVSQFRAQPYHAYWWVTPSSTPTSLGRLLVQYGCPFYSQDVGMRRDLALPIAADDVSPDVVITPIVTEADVNAWLQVYQIGYQLSQAVTDDYGVVLRRILSDYPLIGPYYLARYRGVPVATTSLFIADGVAGVYEVATLPEYRRRGIGAAMVAVALREAQRRALHTAVLQSTADGLGLYTTLGFQAMCTIDAYLI